MIDPDFDPIEVLESLAHQTQVNARAIDSVIQAGDSQSRSLKIMSETINIQNQAIQRLTRRIEELEKNSG